MWDHLSDVENWVKTKYLILVKEIGNRAFRLEDAEKALKGAKMDTGNIKELLSILRKKGLLNVEKDPEDYRRSIYRLLFANVKSISPTRDKLFRTLKAGADLIRGGVDYKVLLVFLFYKALSDKWNSLVDKYIREGYTKTQAYLIANREYYVLYDEDEQKLYTWHEIAKSRDTIREMANALTRISRMNEKLGDLQKLIDVLGLRGFINGDNLHILESIVDLFNSIDFSRADFDIIGDAYQWVLWYFAPQKAKEGENYTPKEVVRLLVELLDIEDSLEVLDPAVGSGSMLIESYRYVREKKKGKNENYVEVLLYGQERNEIIGVIAKLNLILHDIENYEIYIGDSLRNPRFGEADYVIANPPWNQDGYDEEALSEDPRVRRIYTSFVSNGFTPKQSADWAWVQLMLYHTRRKVGIVLDSGALFRGGKEKRIRKEIVQRDLIEAVILLPEKLFYNTGAPGIIMVLNKNKPDERKGKILFINASNEYEQHPEVRRLNRLGEEHIRKIVDAYREFKEIEGFSRVVSVEEIKEKDYNLNVSLYVFPKVEEEEINLAEEYEKFREIEEREKKVVSEAVGYVEDIIKVGGG